MTADGFLMPLPDHPLTVPEAAFVTGHSVRGVNGEIDAGIVPAPNRSRREVGPEDLLYLVAVRDLRAEMGPVLRHRLHRAIAAARAAGRGTASVGHLAVYLPAVEAELAERLGALDRLRSEAIEESADILAGEPVLRGTRIAARHVADMVRQGARTDELVREFDLTPEQVEAAILFDRVNPRRGRPQRRARRVVPAA